MSRGDGEGAMGPAPGFPGRTATLGWAAWSIVAAFGTYFCMYAFRKPFTAASYAGFDQGGPSFKTILVTSQVMGYTLSKFLGIRVVAETPPYRRAAMILLLVSLAELALLAFGVLPAPLSAICLFLNGLTLGMVYGLVIGFLEGRRLTEALAAGLSASFIVADGMTKSAGSWLLSVDCPEVWMPAATGALFVLPILGFVWMLTRIPPPDRHDVAERSERATLDRSQRASFLVAHSWGLWPILLMYLAVTILRSVRADFAPEIWLALGVKAPPSLFTSTEAWVALGVIMICGSVCMIRDNLRALRVSLLGSLLGLVFIPVAFMGHAQGWLGAYGLMVSIGLGLYLPYVAVHTTLLERYLAVARGRGNLGFLMSMADAIGYVGYVAVMLGRSLLSGTAGFASFFSATGWIVAIVSSACVIVSLVALRGSDRSVVVPAGPVARVDAP